MNWKFLWLLGMPALAQAQVLTGPAVAVDGDTLDMNGARVRLFGVDAMEARQTCMKDGQAWACGAEAKALLASLVADQPVRCEQRDTDRYRRVVAICTVAGLDLARTLVEGGLAVALPEYSLDYVDAEVRPRRYRIGIWAGQFSAPSAYRAANPRLLQGPVSPPPAKAPAASAAPAVRRTGGTLFANCAQAWAAGAAPIYAGQPGYRVEMDGDRDGIACEPARGRR